MIYSRFNVMSPIRLLTIDDASLFVEIRRLSLCTDPDSFSARPETDAWSKLETARQRFSTATLENGPFVLGAFDPNLVGVIGLIRATPAAARVGDSMSSLNAAAAAWAERSCSVRLKSPDGCLASLVLNWVSRTKASRRGMSTRRAGSGETGFDAKSGGHDMILELTAAPGVSV